MLARSEKESKRGKVAEEWERERKEYHKVKKWEIEEIEEMRKEGELKGEKIIGKKRRWQEKKRWERIGELRFNK